MPRSGHALRTTKRALLAAQGDRRAENLGYAFFFRTSERNQITMYASKCLAPVLTLYVLFGSCAFAQEPDMESADTSAAEAAIQRVKTETQGKAQTETQAATESSSNALNPEFTSGDHHPTDAPERTVRSRAWQDNPDFWKFEREARFTWHALKMANELKEPFDRILDVQDETFTALNGVVPTTDPIEGLRTYVAALRSRLWSLKQKSVESWEMDSGVNVFQPATYSMAETYLDDWSHQLVALKNSIDNFIPMVKTERFISGGKAMSGFVRGSAMTDELLNPMMIENDILPKLDSSSGLISDIENTLMEASSLITGAAQNARSSTKPPNSLLQSDRRPCVHVPNFPNSCGSVETHAPVRPDDPYCGIGFCK
jgi:hypothetical protein